MRTFIIAALLFTACSTREPVTVNVRRAAAPASTNAPRLVVVNPPASATTPIRNLFAFAHVPPLPASRGEGGRERSERPGEGRAPTPAPVTITEPQFPYRCIGRFGPDASPFAVFIRDGELVNARVGDAIGGYRLQSIGIESVDVVAASGAVQRIPI